MLISEKTVSDGDTVAIIRTHDHTDALNRAEQLRSAGMTGFSDSKLVGTIPAAIVSQWAREAGVEMSDRGAMQEIMRRKLLSGDFSKFRVWEGTY